MLVAGDNDSGRTSELYDPSSGTWTPTGLMVRSRTSFTATRLPDGRVLVVGGDSGGQRNAELYDPKTRTWTATGIPVENRNTHTATLLRDGRVLLAGGNQASADSRPSAELYDPKTGKFSATGRLLKARAGHTATLLPDGRVLVAGGYHNASRTFLATAEIYDPKAGTWSETGKMIEAALFDTATLLPDGKVLVAGGVRGTTEAQVSATAQLYDPGSGTWTATGPMNGARGYHTATLLGDGRVLVTGGTKSHDGSKISLLASAELYDPVSGTWTATASMDGVRVSHSAALLPDGRVLVAGGANDFSADSLLETVELYDLGS